MLNQMGQLEVDQCALTLLQLGAELENEIIVRHTFECLQFA